MKKLIFQFQLHEGEDDLENIHANFEYMDNKAHRDNFIGLCSFRVPTPVEQTTTIPVADEKKK